MRVRSIAVIAAIVAILIMYWTPITISVGDYVYRLGGYPWVAPNPHARNFFLWMGLAISAGGALLIALELKLSREIEGAGEVESAEAGEEDFGL
ncbi:MAG: hypothetical protein J7L75_00255 [Thermoproteales archaeon]|nr:hypothetical protein [Thermoproteales archaeon]